MSALPQWKCKPYHWYQCDDSCICPSKGILSVFREYTNWFALWRGYSLRHMDTEWHWYAVWRDNKSCRKAESNNCSVHLLSLQQQSLPNLWKNWLYLNTDLCPSTVSVNQLSVRLIFVQYCIATVRTPCVNIPTCHQKQCGTIWQVYAESVSWS